MTTALRTARGLLALQQVGACADGVQSPADSGAQDTALRRGFYGTGMGEVSMADGPNGVLFSLEKRGLSPGTHGFHIYAVGACEPAFAAAGDHFNPQQIEHGLLYGDGFHYGGLPNIHASQCGFAGADLCTMTVALGRRADHSLFHADCSAYIVHALPVSYGVKAGAGKRVAYDMIEGQQDRPGI